MYTTKNSQCIATNQEHYLFFSFRILHNASVFLLLPLFLNDKDKYNTTFFLLKVKRLIDAPLRRRAGQKVQRAHTRTREEINNTASVAGRGEEVGWWVEHRRRIIITVQQARGEKTERNRTVLSLTAEQMIAAQGVGKENEQAVGATKTVTAFHVHKKKKTLPEGKSSSNYAINTGH